MDRINKLIIRFFQKETNAIDLDELEKSIRNPADKEKLSDYLKIWLWVSQMEQSEPLVNVEDTWKRIEEKEHERRNKNFRITVFLRYAAVFLILLNVGWWGARFHYQGQTATNEQHFKVSANRFNNSVITLPDQTQVILRPGTNLEYGSRFNKNSREVRLDGEAYFDVTRDEKSPFVVLTEQGRIEVLGTSFNVLTGRGNAIAQTTLVEGKVEFTTRLGLKYQLEPNQTLELNLENNYARVIQVNTELYTSWKDGKIMFRDNTLREITEKLENIYHVKFIYINPELADNYRFSGTLHYETSIGDVISMLKISIPMHVKREERFPEPDRIYLE